MISVLIHNLNRRDELEACLESVVGQTYRPMEVIVADAGSEDGSLDVLGAFERSSRSDDGLSVLVAPFEPSGVAASRNRLAALASGDILCFIDNDAVLADETSLARLAERYEESSAPTLVSFRVLHGDSDGLDPMAWVFRRPQAFGNREFMSFTFAGTGFAVLRTAFCEAGGFWEVLTYSREEEDLALSLLDNGARLIYSPSITIRHYPSSTGRLSLAQRRRVELQNGVLVIRRRIPLLLILPAILVRTASMTIRALREGLDIPLVLGGLPAGWRMWREADLARNPVRSATVWRYLALHRVS